MNREDRELKIKKRQERAMKHGCDGVCYWNAGMCPRVKTCDETRTGELIIRIAKIAVLVATATVRIFMIGTVIILLWSIFAA